MFCVCVCCVCVSRNLPQMDAKGMTDAYVRVKFAGKEVETKTINESLNPNFNNEFLFETTKDSLGQIMFELWDDDVPSDEFIGIIIFKVATKNADTIIWVL